MFLRAGLGAAWHLAKSGYAVDVLEAGPHPGGLVAGWQTPGGRSVEVGIHHHPRLLARTLQAVFDKAKSVQASSQIWGSCC